ncbi:MAG: type II toxin-antitoxin system RelE/ParE family toxin [Gemmatimonadota bacterium]
MFAVGAALSARRDIAKIVQYLRAQALERRVSEEFADRFFDEVDDAIEGLREFPERHPYAPERPAWRRDVRNVLLDTGYRVLFQVRGDEVWVMRVRHQRQRQLKAAGPGSAFNPELLVR